MIHSLRVKFALSNILPIILLAPLLSLYLIYSLESFFTQKLLHQLSLQASLLFDQAQEERTLVDDPAASQRFMASLRAKTDARVILFPKRV